jgi:hypothetical protein
MLGSIQEEVRSDRRSKRIIEAAQNCLQKSPYKLLQAVLCDYDEGILFLRGKLPNFYHKQLAQEAVRRVHGVAWIKNEIEVR